MASSSTTECTQWLSVTEETLFLHDGLLRVTDLVELPKDVEACGSSRDNEVVSFDTKVPEELSARLIELCGTRNNAFSTLQEYRLNALKGLWRAHRSLNLNIQENDENNQEDGAIALLKKQGLIIKDSEQASFSTRISLLLILPLLQSQSKTDPKLCAVTSGVILTCLRDCPPLSLAKEPSDCLSGLESLLCGWLGEKSSEASIEIAKDKQHQENAAAALVALACARGHVKTFIHTVHLLQQLPDMPPLPVADVLSSLLDNDGGLGQISSFLGSKYIHSWGVDDLLGSPAADRASTESKESNDKDKDKDQEIGRSIATDGYFLFTTNSLGKGLAKIGTGHQGTLRGYVYCKNSEIGPGRIACAGATLLFRPQKYDLETENEYLAQLIDKSTLEVVKVVNKSVDLPVTPGPCTSVGFCSDGTYFYWLWCPCLVNDKNAKAINVNVTPFSVNQEFLEPVPLRPNITLQKKEEVSQKSMNEAILNRLRPLRGSTSAATLMALTGGETLITNRKEETPGVGSTSCGILLKTLVKTPIHCDGNHLVMLTQAPGMTSGGGARSLFGGGGGSGPVGGVRCLASSVCFNVKSGFFSARVDLMDALASSLGRGSPPTSLGTCFDVVNNLLWVSSGEYVDQFHNPGNLALHHVHYRLGIPSASLVDNLTDSNLVPVNSVINTLLQTVGSMCLHQMTGDIAGATASSNSVFSDLAQPSLDFDHLTRVTDILDRAVSDQDNQAVICCLVVLQLIFKSSNLKDSSQDTRPQIKNARSLVWKLLTSDKALNSLEDLSDRVKTEACRVITGGLQSLYPTPQDRHALMYDLLTSGNDNKALIQLRDMILTSFASQLSLQQGSLANSGMLLLSDDLVSYVLKLAVKESCTLLKKAQSCNKQQLQEIISDLPMSSPAVLYLASLRSYLLRSAILYVPIETNEESPSDELIAIQTCVLSLASKMIEGACQVLESFLETCNAVLTSCNNGELESWLTGFERLAKSTVLGTLMPVLVTALTHLNLQSLELSQALVPALVALSLLASQAVLLMKNEELAASTSIANGSDLDVNSDKEMAELIGEALSSDVETNLEEEEGFLTGLKIPAPWASGKTVETIHPVRDNYKFKETVHIPGARCLYLRFDSRCSSQYDYDKVVIYAGGSINGKKVVEYGGNPYGFGSRSVLGSGWPKDLVKVEGDTVTLTFEMRSGREHNTPDKAMWGFACTIRAQESAEEETPGLPFLSDLALGLSVLVCTQLAQLYKGSAPTQDEMDCQHLLKSRLLQRCVWTFEHGPDSKRPESMSVSEDQVLKESKTTTKSSALPRIKLPSDTLSKLRKLSKWQPMRVRPTIKAAIQLELLEEEMISAVAKHLGLSEAVSSQSEMLEQEGEELQAMTAIMEETYRRFDILARQLQIMADLEKRWELELEDKVSESRVEEKTSETKMEEKEPGIEEEQPPFFHDFHLRETCHKELVMLAFLKTVPMESDLEAVVTSLLEKFTREVEEMKSKKDKEKDEKEKEKESQPESMSKTKQVVSGILSRLDLLLHVNSVPADAHSALTRTLSHTQGFKGDVMARSDSDMTRHYGFGRSMSAPVGINPDDPSLFRYQRWRQSDKVRRTTSILQDLVDDGDEDKPPHIIVIDQLFAFIGSDPLKTVSCSKFLKAAEERHSRGCSRKRALKHIKELLSAASRVGGATHLVAAVASVLRHGPKVEDLLCGGMVNEVREAFAEAMGSVVQLAAHYPIPSASSIGLLCTIPYTRAEEKCLVRSGLVHLLDKLCSLGSHRTSGMGAEIQTPRQKVSALAWAGFQVLASRCVKWEVEDGSQVEELEHSGLAKQVSMLLTHHLARATEGIGNAMAGTEALQEVLSLLNNLSRSKMGKAILSQPACVSKLLSLLLDQRPSPKLVLIILQLCRVSLPLMNCDDCQEVELPVWGQQLSFSHWSNAQPVSDPPAKIISLLLAKLGDFLVPGEQVLLSSRSSSQEASAPGRGSQNKDLDKSDDSDVQRGRLSVFVHKREDQMSHDVIQFLLSSDNRPFRLVGNTNVDKVVRLDREITKNGKAELTSEEAVSAFRKAYKWAQMGLVVSTAPPSDAPPTENTGTDKKKTASEVICKEKNSELIRSDPIRAFISGHVANAMAAEVIALLYNLLSAQSSSTAHTWAQAVQRVLANALSGLPNLLNSLDSLASPRSPRWQSSNHLMSVAKLANAALCALGGFQETIKPGCLVKVTGEGVSDTTGVVMSISEQNDIVNVLLDTKSDDCLEEPIMSSPSYGDTIKVPFSRVRPVRNELFNQYQADMSDAFLAAVKTVVLPGDEASSPINQPLHSSGDGNAMANQICRVVAEIRTRTSIVLAQYFQNIDFAKKFIEHCGCSIDMLKSLAKDCNTGSRLPVLEAHCQRLRMLYRDCAKPPPPPCRTNIRPSKEMVWDLARPFPPSRACLFSHGMTALLFLGDPSAGMGLPRGTMVYANQPIPREAPSFYWELEISSFGDTQVESGAVVSFGFAPPAEKKDGAWTNPVGTCLFLNTGKAVHYNGASLLQWRSVRLEVTLNAGDIAGIGWERTGDPSDSGQNSPKGQVYFTYNGQRLSASLDSVAGAMYPVVHIQKKNCRVKANFGARPFAYAEGQQHRDAAEAANDVLREIRESFGQLPFHGVSDSESDTQDTTAPTTPSEQNKSLPKLACKTAQLPTTLKEYDVDISQNYKLLPCHDNFVVTGPDSLFSRPQEDDSDEETIVDESASEDHYALLVKAWEQKVFPVIRRRFRNEAERKDGLEQIRGALQLGMTDIARQTVEFLYEENGGIPLDLHLPTIDDIKEELAKFTIDRVKKGTTVIIRTRSGNTSQAATQLPKFAVRSMLKTFGLTGTVLDVDTANELVQVETYLRSEGVLVRFWYPLVMLEKPVQGMRKASITGGQTMDTSNIHIHRELLSSESALAKMYLRTAFLHLTDHCNSPAMEISSCSASLGSGMAACAATLQELDLENIQLLSEHLLRAPYTTGTLEALSPFQTPALSHLATVQKVSLPNLVYRDSLRLKRELAVAISRASSQGEDYLIELTNQLCMCLQTAPELFPFMSFPVMETKVSTDVHFPGAACILVSCVSNPETATKETPPYRAPWARISTYTGKRIKRCGQVTRQEVVCYPRDVHAQTNTCDQYAPAIIPGDRLFVKIGVSPPPGITVTLHALPPQFLLTMAYIETLVTETFGCGIMGCAVNKVDRKNASSDMAASEFGGQNIGSGCPAFPAGFKMDECSSPSLWSLENIVITPLVFMHLIEFVCGFLWKTDIPSLMKEYVFHQLAQTMRILHYSEAGSTSQLTKSSPRFSPIQAMLAALPRELKKLYDTESKVMPKMTTAAGSGLGLGVTDNGRFSTYFHALMEVCLAVSEIIPLDLAAPLMSSKDISDTCIDDNPTSLSSDAPGVSSSGKRKRLKPKKERAAASNRRLSSSEQRAGSEAVDLPEASPSSSSSQVLSQSEDSQGSSTTVASAGSTPPTQMFSLTNIGGAASFSSSGASSSSSSSSSSSQVNPSLKADELSWFTQSVSVSKILRHLALKESQCEDELKAYIKSVAQTLSTPTAQSRLLIITGIPTYLDVYTVKKAMRKVCNSLGGIDRDEIFIPISVASSSLEDASEKTPPAVTAQSQADSGAASGESQTMVATEESQSDLVSQPSQGAQMDVSTNNSKETKLKSKFIEGYAVISIQSKTKVDLVKRAFLKTKWLNLTSTDDAESLEAPEENLNVHTVGQALLTEPEANTALESYLHYKLSGQTDLCGVGEATNQALTEIFYSCYFVDQQQQESGDICLSKDQIMNDAPENLLAAFFNAVRPSKKPVSEAVTSVLRQYGFQRHSDKDSSPPAADKASKGKSSKKLSPRSQKEKQVLGVVDKSQEEKTISVEKEEKKDREEKREREKREKSPRKEGAMAEMASKESKGSSKAETRLLTLEGFIQYTDDLSRQDLRAVWRGLLACGLDFHLDRCACPDLAAAMQMMQEWSLEKDVALVTLANELCQQLAISSARLHPHEIHLMEAHLANEKFSCLQGIPSESIKLRFAFLQHLNNILEVSFLPLIDLRPGQLYSRSTSYILSQLRSLVFYDTKVNFLNRILNASAKRRPDQAAPEITLNPIESIGTGEKTIQASILCQSFRQLNEINSKNLCVRLASGGDPTYSFNVRMTGEEVHGTSGSFRHYLWQVSRELQSASTGLLISSQNKGRWLVKPGTLTYSEENLLIFLGQLLGATIRADIPLGLDLVSTVWKLIVGLTLDPNSDLKQADAATYSYIKKIEMVESESELEGILGDGEARFVYTSLTGEEMEIVSNGHSLPVSWGNRQAYMDSIKQLRMVELSNVWRMQAITTGLASLLPWQLLSLMSASDMEMRTSGQPFISLDFLKAHTMYQVGLVESDPHIEYFWLALESFSQEELARFIKFACNQERIPQICPCQEGGPDSAHVPPYPMKIAPPDGSGPPDSRYIRVETCMFMVKLPQYSSLEVMLQRLRYAINCREDPLSG